VSPPATEPQQPVGSQPAAPRAAPDLNTVIAGNLFGRADATADAPADEPAVVTSLPLELLGVFVSDAAPDDSAAIISQRGRAGTLYHVGEDVPGNATLLEVHQGHVVLRRSGTRETLHFPAPGEGFAARNPVVPMDSAIDDTFADSMDNFPMDQANEFDEGYTEEPEVDMQAESVRDLVDEYRSELEENPSAALEELGVSPVSDDAAEGYRVGDLAQSPYLSQTGLQPGDVILSVNGRPVGDLNQDRLELDNVLAQGSARLEVQRGTRRFFVTASLQ
jgi:general secretion pathway protein C